MVSLADWCLDKMTPGCDGKCSTPSTSKRNWQVSASHQPIKCAHSPIMRIRATTGTGHTISAIGQKSTAEAAMPQKKKIERTQIMCPSELAA
jgi:hypothetical protein